MFVESPATKQAIAARKRRTLPGVMDAPYRASYTLNGIAYKCPYYSRWQNMFTRAYCPKWAKKNPTYTGCSVVAEWHSFMSFRDWMRTQDWEDKQLDKDILVTGNKVYGPDTCIFVSRQVNSLMNSRDNARGSHSLGVYKRDDGKYEAKTNRFGKNQWLGSFATEAEAIKAFAKAKAKYIRELANKEQNPKIRDALYRLSSEV